MEKTSFFGRGLRRFCRGRDGQYLARFGPEHAFVGSCGRVAVGHRGAGRGNTGAGAYGGGAGRGGIGVVAGGGWNGRVVLLEHDLVAIGDVGDLGAAMGVKTVLRVCGSSPIGHCRDVRDGLRYVGMKS